MRIRVPASLGLFAAIAAFFFITVLSYAQTTEETSPSETIKKYRKVINTASEPKVIAGAHYKIGLALEGLGRETEATAEYLKIMINYSKIDDINKKAEKRLAGLYGSFSERARELVKKDETLAKEKDPRIFFAYTKSLYENYRNLGQYDRALSALRWLVNMDPESVEYLIDIGDMYLQGYNDADKAIFHFKKALEASPHNPRAYVELGRSYEKKNDNESAVNAYAKAAEVSPANPWAIYGLRRIDGIRLAEDRRLVKDWYFLGPFDNSDKQGLKRAFAPERKIDLKATYAGKDNATIKWSRPFDYDVSGYVDLNLLFKPHDYVVAYAVTYIHSPDERDIQLRFGSDDGIKIWLNDRKIFNYDISRTAEVDDDVITVNLKKGWNKLLIKVSDTWGSWGFYLRATDLRGDPVEDVIFDPLKDDARVKYVYGKFTRERRFRFTKIAAIYTVGISIFLSGLYFMVSNIRHKVKITRMKEDFISSVSHELKTPIAAVKMLAETLRRGKVKKDARKAQYYDMMIRESDRLTRFINKILDFSKIEKGGKIFYFEKENLVSLAKEAAEIYEDEAQDKELKIEFNAEKDNIPADIDKDAILQVVLNLVDNAHKYSREEKIITVNVTTDGKDARIEVIDRGLGIPKESMEKIFDKFYRIERDMIMGTKGSGLGLAFVKSVVSAHGGRLAVESEVGKGSKFIVSLPVERA
jgi:signal transduction histidine kinase/tetratricopeptide (TPR) repeat protein